MKPLFTSVAIMQSVACLVFSVGLILFGLNLYERHIPFWSLFVGIAMVGIGVGIAINKLLALYILVTGNRERIATRFKDIK